MYDAANEHEAQLNLNNAGSRPGQPERRDASAAIWRLYLFEMSDISERMKFSLQTNIFCNFETPE